MQGGIRRKKDLLPRYKKSGNYDNRQSSSVFGKYSRSLKVIAAYSALLVLAYRILNGPFSDMNTPPTFELESLNPETETVAKVNVPKDKQFHNEVARQQEVQNLNKDTVKDTKLI